jgi:predicted GH43/DUF377 family glycosyl hydrolase/lysophospholipase L1-like esterase
LARTGYKTGVFLFLLLAALVVSAQNAAPWVIAPFTRPVLGNPVIAPKTDSTFIDPILSLPVHWEALHTFNPAAVVRDGKVFVLYRAEDNSGAMEIGGHTSRLGLAESKDGIHFTRTATPVFYPGNDDQKAREWAGGVEDPRIVERDDGTYVLTYTQWNRQTYSVGVATSRDLVHWTKQGPAFLAAAGGKYANLKYKSAGIVTRLEKDKLLAARINGMYWMYWGEGAIHIATSLDLIHWTPVEGPDGQPQSLLQARPGHFDSTFPETGPPPVVTKAGIVLLYNGKNAEQGGDRSLGPNAYAAGEALFDATNPMHMLTQTAGPVLWPKLPYEKTGQYAAGTTFAEGLVWFKKQWFLYYGCADSLVAVATAPGEALPETTLPASIGSPAGSGTDSTSTQASVAKAGPQFYLQDGDTVVFYGDSITEQNYYNQFVELYTATRFPAMKVQFYGAGVGGDRVTGGSGGSADERLGRDVYQENPTVVAIMLGMNDAGYQDTNNDMETKYVLGYAHILDSIHAHAQDARITMLGPSPFDDVTRPVWFPKGYNSVMERYATLDAALAKKWGATFINLNPPVVAALTKANAMDPKMAQLLLPDRVHPEPVTHWVMAEALLKGWNAPALVSSVTIDARSGEVEAQNATVDHFLNVGGVLRWAELENGLPLPLTKANASQALVFELSDIEKELDWEPLKITGLGPGKYALSIDGAAVWTFTEEELATGVNLAIYLTPMVQQAQRVSWLVRDRDEAHYIHLRMRVRKAETGVPDVMQEFEDSLESSIHQEATPQTHLFALTPVPAQPQTQAQPAK